LCHFNSLVAFNKSYLILQLHWSCSICFSRMVSCSCSCSCIGFSHFEHW